MAHTSSSKATTEKDAGMKMKDAGRRMKEDPETGREKEAPKSTKSKNISTPNSCKSVNSHQIPLDRQYENMSQQNNKNPKHIKFRT